MAKDLTIGDKKKTCTNPACNSAAYCCWYETTRELSNVCINRNNLVCQLRREEVFGEDGLEINGDQNFVLAQQTR
jgi:hypothetical protein